MKAITISKKVLQNDDIVILPRREYEKLKASAIPVLYLRDEKAQKLDKRVNKSVREYKLGKTKSIKSLKELSDGN